MSIRILTASTILLTVTTAAVAQMPGLGQQDPVQMFMRADGNGDDIVTMDEIRENRRTLFARLDRNEDGVVNQSDSPRFKRAKEMFAERVAQLTELFDEDGDGSVTSDEFINGPAPFFELADTNADGQVTREEADAARASLPNQGAGAQP